MSVRSRQPKQRSNSHPRAAWTHRQRRLPLSLERLEDRLAPAVTASIDANHMLQVTGDNTDQTIVLRLAPGDSTTLQVVVNGSVSNTFDTSKFTSINVSSGDGNDMVAIDESNGAFTGSAPTTLRGGAGNDTLRGGPSGGDTLIPGSGTTILDDGGGVSNMVVGPSLTGLADQVDTALKAVQKQVNDVAYKNSLPLIGTQLQTLAAGQVIDSFRTQVNNALSNLPATNPDVQHALYTVFGPDGLNILGDTNGDGTVGPDDVVVSQQPAGQDPVVTFEAQLHQPVTTSATENPNLDLGLQGLQFQVATQGGINLGVGFDYDLKFGVKGAASPSLFLDTSKQNELQIQLDASLTPGAQIAAQLFLLQATIQDGTADPTPADRTDATSFKGTINVDLTDTDTSATKDATMTSLSNLGMTASLTAQADVNLYMQLSFASPGSTDPSTVSPRLLADFNLVWGFTNADTTSAGTSFGDAPKVAFNHVRLDLGSFFSNMVAPLISELQQVTEPLQPLVDVLTERIPVLSDLTGSTVTFADLLKDLSGDDVSPFIKAINTINHFDIPSVGNATVDLGSFQVTDLRKPTGDTDVLSDSPTALDTILQEVGIEAGGSWLTQESDMGGGFPILEHPLDDFKLLLGKPVDMFTYTIPAMAAFFGLDRTYPLFPPLFSVEIKGGLTFEASAIGGYDTTGLQEYVSDPSHPASDLLDGFFVSQTVQTGTFTTASSTTQFISNDFINSTGNFIGQTLTFTSGADKGKSETVTNFNPTTGTFTFATAFPSAFQAGDAFTVKNPIFSIQGTLAASLQGGLDIVVASVDASLTGGITATVTFGLDDIHNDNKLRASDIASLASMNPLCIFDIAGKVSASLDASVTATLLGFTVYNQSFNLASVDLVNYDFNCHDASTPHLADLGLDGTLTLLKNSGGNTITVSHVSGPATDETVTVTSEGQSQTIAHVKKIFFDDTGGTGPDTITVQSGVLDDAEIHGGDGGDRLYYSGSGTAKLYGGSGNDQLQGGSGTDLLSGGGGNDTLKATSGDDTLDAGGGTAKLYGGTGTNVFKGGAGTDTFVCGTGSNTVTGGSGTDTVIWNLGDGDLSFTSGGGQNELDVTGTTGDDSMSVTAASGGGIAVTTSVGNVSATGMQKVDLIGSGGADIFTVGDLSGTGVTGVGIQANPGASGDGAAATVTVHATATSNKLSVTAPTSYALSVNGLPYQVAVLQMSAADKDRLIVAANDNGDTIQAFQGVEQQALLTMQGGTGNDTFYGGFGLETMIGGGGTDTVVVTRDANMSLTDTSLTVGTDTHYTLVGVQQAQLTGGAGANSFTVSNWTGTADLDGVGNSDTYQIDFNGSGSGIVHVTDTGSGPPSSNLDTLTVSGTAGSDAITISAARVARGTEQVNYSGLESVTVNGAPNPTGTAPDIFNVTSTSVLTTVNAAAVGAGGGSNVNVVNVGSTAPTAGGIVDSIQGPLVIVGAGPDTMNVDDTGSTAPKSSTLTPTTLTGLNMGNGGITYGGLSTLNVRLGSGGSTIPGSPVGNTFTINDINPLTHTSVDGGVSNNDTANVTFAADFNGRLDLTAFEHGTVTVNGNFNSTLKDTLPGHLEAVQVGGSVTSTGSFLAGSVDSMTVGQNLAGSVVILGSLGALNLVNGSMASTGVLQVGSLDTMTIGPAHLSVGQDMAGQIVVSGTLGSLRVAGGAPGSITAGHVGTVAAYGGFGPVVLQITENGIQRRVEEATPANPYPLPNPNVTAATSPYATVTSTGALEYVNIQYFYESGTLANPQLTARVTNSVSTAADQYDLSLVTYNDTAKFNLARLDAAGVSGVSNVAVEGDVLNAVSSQAASFFVGDSTPAGVRLPLDRLAGVAVRDYLPAGVVQAKSIQGLAFGSYTTPNGSLATGSAANGNAAAGLVASGTAIVQANDNFRVPFADLATQQVGLFLATATGGGSFSNANVILVVQGVPSPNAAGTGNTITPSNVARGAVTALVYVIPTFVSGKPAGSVIQTISLRGDGASIRTSQYIASAITSTGPLGDLQLQNTLGITDVTAPSIFGSILAQGSITGTIQTTGQRTDPISSVVTPVSADLGTVYVASSSHGPYLTVTTIQTSTVGTGRIISRGKLLSQVQVSGGFGGLVAAQGDIGTMVGSTRLGGILISGTLRGQIVTLGKAYGDLVVRGGGSLGGRIAAQGGFLGNVTINGTLHAASVIVSGGELGDVSLGTHLTVNGTNYGIIAAEGPANLGKAVSTGAGGGYQANLGTGNPNKAAIDAVFTNNGQSLAFDLAGLDLGGLALILADLKALTTGSNGNLTGPVA
jgi:hypothetical protein